MTALLTLLTPIAAKTNVYLLIAVRVIEGIFEGVTFPCIHAVWSKWSPPLERSRMASIAFAGNYAGTVVSMPLSGILANSVGWESIFYVFGSIGIVWFIAWIIIVRKSPQDDPYISEEEKIYIMKSLGDRKEDEALNPPWREIFTSTAVWAIVASHVSENWGFYTLLTQLPTFLNGNFLSCNTVQMDMKIYSLIIHRRPWVPFRKNWIHVCGSLPYNGDIVRCLRLSS